MWITVHRHNSDGPYDDGYDSLWEGDDESQSESDTSDTSDVYDDIPSRPGSTVLSNIATPSPESEAEAENDEFHEYRKDRLSFIKSLKKSSLQNPSINEHKAYIADEIASLQERLNRHAEDTVSYRFQNMLLQQSGALEANQRASLHEDKELNRLEAGIKNLNMKRRQRIEQLEKKERERLEEIQRRLEEAERLRREQEEKQRRLEAERRRIEEERKRKEEEEKRRQEEERKKIEAAEKAMAEEKARLAKIKAEEERLRRLESAKPSKFTDWAAVESQFVFYKQIIANIKTNVVQKVIEKSEWKKACYEVRRNLRPRLGQLTNSWRQIESIYTEIEKSLTQMKSAFPDPEPYLFILNFLAKCIVSQAESEVALSPKTAGPLGEVAARCLACHPELLDILIARFVKKCPYVIGFTCSVDTEQGRINMGYKRTDGKWEDDAYYSERIAGIVTLWTVITYTQIDRQQLDHPYPIHHTWTFLARQANIENKLLSNAHFTAVAAWWDVLAEKFLQIYGRQAEKLLMLLWREWTGSCSDRMYPAAARLRLLGEEWVNTGTLKSLIPPIDP